MIEDEAAVRTTIARILRAAGYQVLEASGGDEALLRCEHHEGEIKLALTDVVMPQMNGRALAEKLVKMRPGLRVVYMSGYMEETIARHGLLSAGVNFIGKPFTAADLTHLIRKVIDAPAAN